MRLQLASDNRFPALFIAKRARRAEGEIEASAGPARRAAVIDAHFDFTCAEPDADHRAESQRAMRGRHPVRLEVLAVGCDLAGLAAVPARSTGLRMRTIPCERAEEQRDERVKCRRL